MSAGVRECCCSRGWFFLLARHRRETRVAYAASMQRLVVIGNGMVGHELVRLVVEAGGWQVTVFGEEPRAAYDRVHLSEWFARRDAASLAIATPEWYAEHGVELRAGR